MRKYISIVSAVVAIVSSAFLYVGCTKDQVVAIARQAGTVAAVSWVAADNPSADQKTLAVQVVAVIKSNAASVSTGMTYYAALTPVVNTYVDKSVPAKDQAIARLASSMVLTGVDTFFAMYPEYAADSTTALQVVSSFCDGAQVGMAMSKDSPVMRAAMQGAAQRTKDRQMLK